MSKDEMSGYPNYPEWFEFDAPIRWRKHDLTVIGDRFAEDGVREHLVLEKVPEGCILSNARIFTKE